MHRVALVTFTLILAACQRAEEPAAVETTEPAAEPAAAAPVEADRLAAVLADQPDAVKARYAHRNPQETLEFFGIEPGMTVLEALPGGGWYSKILLSYLGPDGRLIGADYSNDMYPLFSFATEEYLARKAEWVTTWTADAEGWSGDDGAAVTAFHLGSMPGELEGTADAAIFIRALHNLARFRDEGPFLDEALDEAYRALKPGGVLGVVQHEARADMPDDWAIGSNGYVKKQFVIDRVTAAGFEFVAESDVNENPNDRPTTEDFVWRLPPSLRTSRDDPELRAELEAVGESHRMTLKFRKPDQGSAP